MSETQMFLMEFTVFFSVAGILLCAVWAWKRPIVRGVALAPMLWFFHALVFSVMRLMAPDVISEELATWSVIVRLHAVFTVIGGILIFWNYNHDRSAARKLAEYLAGTDRGLSWLVRDLEHEKKDPGRDPEGNAGDDPPAFTGIIGGAEAPAGK